MTSSVFNLRTFGDMRLLLQSRNNNFIQFDSLSKMPEVTYSAYPQPISNRQIQWLPHTLKTPSWGNNVSEWGVLVGDFRKKINIYNTLCVVETRWLNDNAKFVFKSFASYWKRMKLLGLNISLTCHAQKKLFHDRVWFQIRFKMITKTNQRREHTKKRVKKLKDRGLMWQ